MIAYFLLGIGLLVSLVLLLKWASETEPRNLLRALGWSAAVLGVILGLALLWAGRYQFAWIALPALYALLRNWRQIRQALRSASTGGSGASPGRSSKVETRFLAMTLEHDTGVMTGEVRAGQYAGCRVESLGLQDLLALWHEVAAEDAQSAAVLEAYMDKVHGDAWREAAAQDGDDRTGGAAGGGSGQMEEAEALEILGLEPGASPEQVRKAYRSLMHKLHPDKGGSDWFAAKLNEAKRVLIGE